MGFSVSSGGALQIHPIQCDPDDVVLGLRVVDTGQTNVESIDPEKERTIWSVRSTEGAVAPDIFTVGMTPEGWLVTHELEEPIPSSVLRVYSEERWATGKVVTVRELVPAQTLESGRIRVKSRSLSPADFDEYIQDEACP